MDKVEIIAVVCFVSVLLASVGFFVNISNDATVGMNTNNCENFNGKEFLLTGGTGTPETIQEINIEASRLNWLCNGGNNK